MIICVFSIIVFICGKMKYSNLIKLLSEITAREIIEFHEVAVAGRRHLSVDSPTIPSRSRRQQPKLGHSGLVDGHGSSACHGPFHSCRHASQL